MDHEDDDPGTTWNERARQREPECMSPRMAWRAIQAGHAANEAIMSFRHRQQLRHRQCLSDLRARAGNIWRPGSSAPADTAFRRSSARRSAVPDTFRCIGFAGDGAFGISMNEMTACGRNDWPPITMVVFRNYQWGAEKRNYDAVVLDDNFVGTELDLEDVSYARIAAGLRA